MMQTSVSGRRLIDRACLLLYSPAFGLETNIDSFRVVLGGLVVLGVKDGWFLVLKTGGSWC